MVNAEEYINENYKDKTIKVLNIKKKNLEGELNLKNFTNLEKLDCSHNLITSLNLTNCPVVELNCSDNNLTSLDFLSTLNKKKLEFLSLHSNKLISQDLSVFSKFVNLKNLFIGSKEKENDFQGSLVHLKDLEKLEGLDISNTDIDDGLEYLSSSIKSFYISTDLVFRTRMIVAELTKFGKPTGGAFSSPNFASLLAT